MLSWLKHYYTYWLYESEVGILIPVQSSHGFQPVRGRGLKQNFLHKGCLISSGDKRNQKEGIRNSYIMKEELARPFLD